MVKEYIKLDIYRRAILRYGSIAAMARQLGFYHNTLWGVISGKRCSLQTAVKIEKLTDGLITCVMIAEAIEKRRSLMLPHPELKEEGESSQSIPQ